MERILFTKSVVTRGGVAAVLILSKAVFSELADATYGRFATRNPFKF